MQGLQEKILRNDQVIADSQLAREAYQRLTTDVDTEKQKNQQLEEQIVLLRHSEATLESSITFLEQEKDELRIAVEVHQAEPRKSEQKIAELEAQLRTVNEDLRKSNAAAQGHERQILREKLNFCKYRADALVHLANLRKHTWQITDDGKAKTRECSSLKQDVAELRAQLDSAQTKTNQLTTKVSQYDGDMKIIKQEKNDAIEKEGRTRELFQSAKDLNHELQNENRNRGSSQRSGCIKECRTRARFTVFRIAKASQRTSRRKRCKRQTTLASAARLTNSIAASRYGPHCKP
jgi:phage shock protein A